MSGIRLGCQLLAVRLRCELLPGRALQPRCGLRPAPEPGRCPLVLAPACLPPGRVPLPRRVLNPPDLPRAVPAALGFLPLVAFELHWRGFDGRAFPPFFHSPCRERWVRFFGWGAWDAPSPSRSPPGNAPGVNESRCASLDQPRLWYFFFLGSGFHVPCGRLFPARSAPALRRPFLGPLAFQGCSLRES